MRIGRTIDEDSWRKRHTRYNIIPSLSGADVCLLAYHVDPAGDHDDCMQAFYDNGIYLFLDVDTFTTQIEESDPMWNITMFTDFTTVIDVFSKYDNLAGFFIANEVCFCFERWLIVGCYYSRWNRCRAVC
jgi:Glucanosyltransferase